MIENLDKLSEIGVVGVVIIWVIREVAAIVKAKNEGGGGGEPTAAHKDQLNRIEEDLENLASNQNKIAVKLYELHKWHDVDELGTGVKVWYATGLKEDIKLIKEKLQTLGGLS